MLLLKRFIFVTCALLFCQCAALHRDIPKATRNHRTAEYGEKTQSTKEKQVVVSTEQIEVPKEQEFSISEQNQAANKEVGSVELKTELVDEVTPKGNEKSLSLPVVDTLYVNQSELNNSEKVAKNARGYALAMIFGLFFFPILLVGLIGSLVNVQKVNRMKIVSAKAIKIKRQAVTIVIVTSVLVVLSIALIVAIIFLF